MTIISKGSRKYIQATQKDNPSYINLISLSFDKQAWFQRIHFSHVPLEILVTWPLNHSRDSVYRVLIAWWQEGSERNSCVVTVDLLFFSGSLAYFTSYYITYFAMRGLIALTRLNKDYNVIVRSLVNFIACRCLCSFIMAMWLRY